jgi:hypothetical protein
MTRQTAGSSASNARLTRSRSRVCDRALIDWSIYSLRWETNEKEEDNHDCIE